MYAKYIETKVPRHAVTYCDLLHVRNFKGGNASIIPPDDIRETLQRLSGLLGSIFGRWHERSLVTLSVDDVARATDAAVKFFAAVEGVGIRGLKTSYSSVILAAHFPSLFPIIDRRVLNGARVDHETRGNGQVQGIERYYPPLMNVVKEIADETKKSLREIDRMLFVVPLHTAT